MILGIANLKGALIAAPLQPSMQDNIAEHESVYGT